MTVPPRPEPPPLQDDPETLPEGCGMPIAVCVVFWVLFYTMCR